MTHPQSGLHSDFVGSSFSEPRLVAPQPISGTNNRIALKTQLKACAKSILDLGVIRTVLDSGKPWPAYCAALNHCTPSWNKFRGVYKSFEQAVMDAPKGKLLGYDHRQIATIYSDYATFVLPSDYPAMFWLEQQLRKGLSVFDFGGNTGISFFAWQKYLTYPPNFRWTVCDLPAVIESGRELASEHHESRLTFTSKFEDADGVDVLLSAGTVQYVESRLSTYIGQLTSPPMHLLINRVPLHETRECVTLQNIKWMVSPYHVFQRSRFVEDIEALGYDLADSWSVPELSCWIPFYPEYSLECYSGLYFRRK